MTELVFIVEEDPDGGYTPRAVGESIFTEADDLEQLRANVREAVDCHFDLLRAKMMAPAPVQCVSTDEDVFDRVS